MLGCLLVSHKNILLFFFCILYILERFLFLTNQSTNNNNNNEWPESQLVFTRSIRMTRTVTIYRVVHVESIKFVAYFIGFTIFPCSYVDITFRSSYIYMCHVHLNYCDEEWLYHTFLSIHTCIYIYIYIINTYIIIVFLNWIHIHKL